MNLIIMKYPRTKEATAIARRRPTSFQTPLFFTQPPEDGRAGVQGAGNQHHTAYFPRLLDRRLEGVHDIGRHPGPPPFAVSWTVLAHEVRGVRRPFVLGAREHEDLGLFSQLGKHTSDVFVSQDPEDHPQGPLSVSTPHSLESGSYASRIVPAVHDDRYSAHLVHLEAAGQGSDNDLRDPSPLLPGQRPAQQDLRRPEPEPRVARHVGRQMSEKRRLLRRRLDEAGTDLFAPLPGEGEHPGIVGPEDQDGSRSETRELFVRDLLDRLSQILGVVEADVRQ